MTNNFLSPGRAVPSRRSHGSQWQVLDFSSPIESFSSKAACRDPRTRSRSDCCQSKRATTRSQRVIKRSDRWPQPSPVASQLGVLCACAALSLRPVAAPVAPRPGNAAAQRAVVLSVVAPGIDIAAPQLTLVLRAVALDLATQHCNADNSRNDDIAHGKIPLNFGFAAGDHDLVATSAG